MSIELKNKDLMNYYNERTDRIEIEENISICHIDQEKAIYIKGNIFTNNISTKNYIFCRGWITCGDLTAAGYIYCTGTICSSGKISAGGELITGGPLKGIVTKVWGIPCRYYIQIKSPVEIYLSNTHIKIGQTLLSIGEFRDMDLEGYKLLYMDAELLWSMREWLLSSVSSLEGLNKGIKKWLV